jgi:glyoxylase I family protein
MVEEVKEVQSNLEKKAYITPSKPAFNSVSCLYIPALDPDKLHEWFNRLFGLETNGWTKLANGLSLIFVKSESVGRMTFEGHWANNPNFKMHVLAFETDDVVELHRTLKEYGVEVEDLRDDGGCGIGFDFYDPEGNRYGAYELQTMVWLHVESPMASSPNLDRFGFGNCCFSDTGVDAFLKKVVEDAPGATRRIQILGPSIIREKDPEGLDELMRVLEQFNQQYPDKAFRIVYQEE